MKYINVKASVICVYCKKQQGEKIVSVPEKEKTETHITHGICHDCYLKELDKI